MFAVAVYEVIDDKEIFTDKLFDSYDKTYQWIEANKYINSDPNYYGYRTEPAREFVTKVLEVII